jgi:demethylmenaquinone methyltransferase/2-methoxy-6-polyprenyl-1,4-benzoquinol methylase
MLDKYKLVGRSYDFLSKLYSGNAIINCKLSMLNEHTIGPNSKVLFAGAGQGRDVLKAAELGANVTMVDISPTMMSKFNQLRIAHPESEQLQIHTVLSDILKQEQFGEYDMVVSNFFLNVFDEDKMNTLLTIY